MSFDQDPNEQANISGADLAQMVDHIKELEHQLAAEHEARKKAEEKVEEVRKDCEYYAQRCNAAEQRLNLKE